MKLNLLMKCLKTIARNERGAFAACEFDDNEVTLINYAIDELTELQCKTVFKTDQEVVFVDGISMSDLLNQLTYDIYGRAARINGNKLSFDAYREVTVDNLVPCEYLTDEAMYWGYDVISDLWHDNETTGANKPDGAYNADRHAKV